MKKLGLLFPGQGSQASGMGASLYQEYPEAREVFEEASEAIKIDMRRLCVSGSDADLALTENTQPALLTVSTAAYRVLANRFPLQIIAAAGHSIGEYAACVAAGIIGLGDATMAVRLRGQAMQSAVPMGKGAMFAVLGLEPKELAELCLWAEKESGHAPIEIANINAPGQIVISGSAIGLNWFKDNYQAPEGKKVRFIPLAVSAPFHCSLMKPAEEKMRLVLNATTFSQGRFPIVQNFVAEAVTFPNKIRENLILQVSGKVLWIECVQSLDKLGCELYLELGHGKVLAGLMKKILPEKPGCVLGFQSSNELKTLENSLSDSLPKKELE